MVKFRLLQARCMTLSATYYRCSNHVRASAVRWDRAQGATTGLDSARRRGPGEDGSRQSI